jgi:hypothetical protein
MLPIIMQEALRLMICVHLDHVYIEKLLEDEILIRCLHHMSTHPEWHHFPTEAEARRHCELYNSIVLFRLDPPTVKDLALNWIILEFKRQFNLRLNIREAMMLSQNKIMVSGTEKSSGRIVVKFFEQMKQVDVSLSDFPLTHPKIYHISHLLPIPLPS